MKKQRCIVCKEVLIENPYPAKWYWVEGKPSCQDCWEAAQPRVRNLKHDQA